MKGRYKSPVYEPKRKFGNQEAVGGAPKKRKLHGTVPGSGSNSLEVLSSDDGRLRLVMTATLGGQTTAVATVRIDDKERMLDLIDYLEDAVATMHGELDVDVDENGDWPKAEGHEYDISPGTPDAKPVVVRAPRPKVTRRAVSFDGASLVDED